MLIVIDDVLSFEDRNKIFNFFSQNSECRKMRWENFTLNALTGSFSPLAMLLKIASKYFNFHDMVGAEYWAHYGTKPEWHIDKDERMQELNGKLSFPICSIVYYAHISMKGGKFMTENISIEPVTNRMIIFSPGILHGVEPYTGERLSVAVNPWTTKPLGYL